MSDNKHFWAVLLCLGLALPGCIPHAALMDPDRPAGQLPPNFFKNVLSVIDANEKGAAKDALSDTMETYVARFSERYIEKDDLLTLSILSESSRYPRVRYDDLEGYHQALFLYHLRTKKKDLDMVAYLAAKYDFNGVCIGLGPAYLGTVDKGEGHIDFLYQMKVTIDHGDTCLKLQSNTHIMFLAERLITQDPWWQWMGVSNIPVTKIVDYTPNKIGGRDPVVYSIHAIMPDDRAILFIPVK